MVVVAEIEAYLLGDGQYLTGFLDGEPAGNGCVDERSGCFKIYDCIGSSAKRLCQ